MKNIKYQEFLKISKKLNEKNIIPTLIGSLGFELLTGKDFNSQDIDIHVPGDSRGWEVSDDERIFSFDIINEIMVNEEYELIDLHEHEFFNGKFHVEFGSIDSIMNFAGIDHTKLKLNIVDDIKFYSLNYLEYLWVYNASLKDSYRANNNNNKDLEKIKYIENNFEIWDAYNKNCEKLDVQLIRGERVPTGYYHLVSEILVLNSNGKYLVTRRSLDKKIEPGSYEASAGGSVLKGESALDAAKRELFEETGIRTKVLIETYTVVTEKYKTIFKGFIANVDVKEDSIVLQKGETIGYKWLNKDELLDFIKTDEYVSAHRDRLKLIFEKME